jgi:hypothetical protein
MRDGGVDEVPAVLGGQSPLIPWPMKLDPEDGKNFAHQRARQAQSGRSITGRHPSLPYQLQRTVYRLVDHLVEKLFLCHGSYQRRKDGDGTRSMTFSY